MTSTEWGLLVGLALTVGMATAPWMFMVHAKLAVIAGKVDDLGSKLDAVHQTQAGLQACCGSQETRLQTHDVQINYLSERIGASE